MNKHETRHRTAHNIALGWAVVFTARLNNMAGLEADLLNVHAIYIFGFQCEFAALGSRPALYMSENCLVVQASVGVL